MYAVSRVIARALVLVMLIALVSYIESSSMIIEYYVYEFSHKTEHHEAKLTVKLVRLDDKTYKVELLRFEPEDSFAIRMKTQLELKLNLTNWTMKLMEINNDKHYYLIFPDTYFPLYLEPKLVRIGCEKAPEIERVVKDFVNPSASNEQRLRLINMLKNRSIEVVVISMLVGDPLITVGLRGHTAGFTNAHYKLTARCNGGTYTFSSTSGFQDEPPSRSKTVYEATSRYSSTGWLMNAVFSVRRTYDTGSNEQTWSYTIEQELVETSNEDLRAHAFPTTPTWLQAIEETITNPLTVATIIAVVLSTLALWLVKRR